MKIQGAVTSLGGGGERSNGGTIKIFYKDIMGGIPDESAGRVYMNGSLEA